MSRTQLFFAEGEWYHCYSRGIDKRVVFQNQKDYQRFVELLYLTNAKETLHRSDLKHYSHEELFTIPRKNTLVEIGAWALLPNHFHLLLHEKTEGGISAFMQKLGTAYTMYFNIKYERSGGLFTKPFRARRVGDDRYLQHVIDYIHLNPLPLFGKEEKNTTLNQKNFEKLLTYSYTSFGDFGAISRPEKNILGGEVFEVYRIKKPEEMVKNALRYRNQHE